jgi:site-specific recombinase XerD
MRRYRQLVVSARQGWGGQFNPFMEERTAGSAGGKRDYQVLAILLGCGLRRTELVQLGLNLHSELD